MKRARPLLASLLLLVSAAACPDSEPHDAPGPPSDGPADAAGTGGGGSGAGGSGTGAGGGIGGPGGSGGGGGGEPGTTVPLSFTLPGADGAAEATAGGGGQVRVTKLPETFRATPRLGATVVPFPAQLDARFCEDVRSSARNAGNALFPPDSRRLARELVRTPTDQDVDLPFATTLVDGTLRGAAETAARAAGVSSPRFEPLPPIRVTRLEAIYEGDAQTKLLGALEEIQEDLDEALAFGAAASASGILRLSTNAADLLCDLWTRRAQIVVHYTVGAAPARTLLTGLDPRTGP